MAFSRNWFCPRYSSQQTTTRVARFDPVHFDSAARVSSIWKPLNRTWKEGEKNLSLDARWLMHNASGGEKKLGRKMLIQIQISSPSFYCYYSTSRRSRTLFLTLLTDCRVQQFCNFPLNIYIFSYKIKRNVQIDADTTPARDSLTATFMM